MLENIYDSVKIHLLDRTRCLFSFRGGTIQYFSHNLRDDEIAIFGIWLHPGYQRQGVLTSLLNKIIDQYPHITRIWILEPNWILATILQTRKFNNIYFVNRYTGEFVWTRNYIDEKSEEIARQLAPALAILRSSSIQDFSKYIIDHNLGQYM